MSQKIAYFVTQFGFAFALALAWGLAQAGAQKPEKGPAVSAGAVWESKYVSEGRLTLSPYIPEGLDFGYATEEHDGCNHIDKKAVMR